MRSILPPSRDHCQNKVRKNNVWKVCSLLPSKERLSLFPCLAILSWKPYAIMSAWYRHWAWERLWDPHWVTQLEVLESWFQSRTVSCQVWCSSHHLIHWDSCFCIISTGNDHCSLNNSSFTHPQEETRGRGSGKVLTWPKVKSIKAIGVEVIADTIASPSFSPARVWSIARGGGPAHPQVCGLSCQEGVHLVDNQLEVPLLVLRRALGNSKEDVGPNAEMKHGTSGVYRLLGTEKNREQVE